VSSFVKQRPRDINLSCVSICRLDVRLMDGQALDLEPQFDAVFSHAAMHWMHQDPDAVIQV